MEDDQEAVTYLRERYPHATLIRVEEVDMRAINAYQRWLPNGRAIFFRANRDSRAGHDFVQYQVA